MADETREERAERRRLQSERQNALMGINNFPIREDGRRPCLMFRSLSDIHRVEHKTPRWWIYDEILDQWHVGRAGVGKWSTLNAAMAKWDLGRDEYLATRHTLIYRGVEAGTLIMMMMVDDCRTAARYRQQHGGE